MDRIPQLRRPPTLAGYVVPRGGFIVGDFFFEAWRTQLDNENLAWPFKLDPTRRDENPCLKTCNAFPDMPTLAAQYSKVHELLEEINWQRMRRLVNGVDINWSRSKRTPVPCSTRPLCLCRDFLQVGSEVHARTLKINKTGHSDGAFQPSESARCELSGLRHQETGASTSRSSHSEVRRRGGTEMRCMTAAYLGNPRYQTDRLQFSTAFSLQDAVITYR